MLRNHLIPLTVVKILSEKETFTKVDFKGKKMDFFDALMEFTVDIVLRQHHNIASQDEIGTWWRIFAALLMDSKDPLKHGKDIMVQKKSSVKIKKPGGKGKEKEDVKFDGEKKLLFLRWPGTTYSRYAVQASKEGLIKFNVDSLMTYFEQSDAFIGLVLAKKFNKGKTNSRALVFDADMLYEKRDIDLQLTKNVLSDDESTCTICAKTIGEDCTCEEDTEKVFGPKNPADKWK